MRINLENNSPTIFLEGRIDSNNAAQTEYVDNGLEPICF